MSEPVYPMFIDIIWIPVTGADGRTRFEPGDAWGGPFSFQNAKIERDRAQRRQDEADAAAWENEGGRA